MDNLTEWYNRAKTVGYDLYREPHERVCLDLLLEYVIALKHHVYEAQYWFSHPFQEGWSLQFVCDMLGLPVGEVQRRARRMMEMQDRNS